MSTTTSSSTSSTTGTSSIYNSSSRITGMFSNMDTDSIVKNLCSGQQSKIDKQYQSKTTYQWQEDAWSTISDAVSDFSDTYCSSLGSSSMLKSSTYVAYSVNTSDTSGAVQVTAGSGAAASTVKVSVQQTAKNASVTSTAAVSSSSTGDGLSSSNTVALAKLAFKTPLQFDTQGNISFSINGKKFTFSSDATLQSMINTVNSDSDANVTMKYSRLTDTFTITADSGGENSKVAIKNLSGNAFSDSGAFGISETTTPEKGRNAKVTIDDGSGTVTTLEKDSNSFTIDGLTYQLNDTTSSAISFRVERDYSSTVDAVQKFVDTLNTVITKITGYTNGKDNSQDYPPLTETQKSGMTEDQIEKWEEKAKTGILRHNSTLETLVTNLKNAFFSSAGGTGKTAASIGISTASYFSSNAGQVTVDTDQLKEALASDPNLVMDIFTGGNSSAASDQQGVMYKLRNILNTFDKTAGDTVDKLGDKVDDTEESISDMEDKLSDMADRYYEKFSAMETALSKLNSTSSMITSMFSAS